ncbi:hypothetical protein Bca4012_046103 [Brassica carinata]
MALGIPKNATVAESRDHRRRYHQFPILKKVEEEIDKFRVNATQEEDVSLWRNNKGKYKRRFSIKETWLSIRENSPTCYWHQAVWFKHSTPRYSFITWVAMCGRLSTGDRMRSWNGNAFYQAHRRISAAPP